VNHWLLSLAFAGVLSAQTVLVPDIDGQWWTVAGNPDLGPLTSPKQQPVDFGVWQAADGTWQLWSCIEPRPHPAEPAFSTAGREEPDG